MPSSIAGIWKVVDDVTLF